MSAFNITRRTLGSCGAAARVGLRPAVQPLRLAVRGTGRRMAHTSTTSRSGFKLLPGLMLAGGSLALLMASQAPVYSDVPATPSTRADPATGVELPLRVKAGKEELHLLGLGVRTVTFLRVQVYTAALYVEPSALKEAVELVRQGKSAEETMRHLLQKGLTALVRIVPVKNTDMNHLRDGFLKSLNARAKRARKASALGEADEAPLEAALDALKGAFPKASVPKGSALDLIFSPTGVELRYDNETLGRVQETTSHSELWAGAAGELLLAYVADKNEISGAFKKSIEQGLAHVAHTGTTPVS